MNIHLGQKIGQGGEGTVYSIDGHQDQVAKIYSTQLSRQKIDKLVTMAEVGSAALLRVAAWPMDLLKNNRNVICGFVMPRIVTRRNIHELYSPKSRSEAFPDADFRFLVHVSTNIARAFAVVHEHGHVIGDVNHGNLMIGPDGTVMLIDCDSFQIKKNGLIFSCDVGVPLFTPPELHGLSLRGIQRNPNHDLFGLAILLFHMLFMGRHPFAGKYLGAGEMPIEKAITEYRFAYGINRGSNLMERPPGTIPLETMGSVVASSFERAFSKSGAIQGRPDAKSWIDALENLKTGLRLCSQSNRHFFPSHLNSCPWCSNELQTGVVLFKLWHRSPGLSEYSDISMLWQSITLIRDPGPAPLLPSEHIWKPPAGVKVPNSTLKDIRIATSIMLCLCGFVAFAAINVKDNWVIFLAAFISALLVWPWVSSEKRMKVERAFDAAKAEWNNELGRWRREASRDIFTEKLRTLEKARADLIDLPNERRKRIALLEAQRENKQRQRYLDRFRIDRAQIPGIGPGRTAMLVSYGIETAADVDRYVIMEIPGFGEVLTDALARWRNYHERNFRYNPNEPVDQRDIYALDQELETQRRRLLIELQEGPVTLGKLSRDITAARISLMPGLDKAWNKYKIALAERDSI